MIEIFGFYKILLKIYFSPNHPRNQKTFPPYPYIIIFPLIFLSPPPVPLLKPAIFAIPPLAPSKSPLPLPIVLPIPSMQMYSQPTALAHLIVPPNSHSPVPLSPPVPLRSTPIDVLISSRCPDTCPFAAGGLEIIVHL